MKDAEINNLADTIRESAFAVHKYFRNGFLEKVYENSLRNRLQKIGLDVRQQVAIPVFDEDGAIVGDYFADLIVEDSVLIELKSAKGLVDEHIAQVLAYLRATDIKHGILINFGAPKLQIRKFIQ